MTLALMLLAATALAQAEGAPPPPPPPAAPIVAGVPDDQVPAEADAPPEFPRVVRRGDQICQQSVTQDGQIASECRAAQLAHSSQPPSSGVRFIGSIGALGGGAVLFALGDGVGLGAFGAFSQAGVQFTELLGLVLVVNLWVALTNGLDLEVISFAPGLRLGGSRVSVTFSLGPSVLVGRISTADGSAAGTDVAGTFLTTGVFRVAGPFSLFAQAGASFQSSGLVLHFGAGLGASL